MNEAEDPIIKEVTEAATEDIALTATYNILFTNDLAFSRIAELIYQVKKSPYYKQEVKKDVNRIFLARKEFETRITQVIGPQIEFFSDTTQTIEEECSSYITQMRNHICEELQKAGHPNAVLMSYAETAYTLTQLACVNLDYRIREMKQRRVPECERIKWLRITGIYQLVGSFCRILNKATKCNQHIDFVDLNQCEGCKSALRSLEKKLTDAHVIARAIAEGEKNNPILNKQLINI